MRSSARCTRPRRAAARRRRALRSAVEHAQREAARLRRENRVLERQARQDALTGLANRRAFDDALAARVAEAREAGTPLAVVAFDLDHFKSINDRYTHAAGDAVLREAANVLRAYCRRRTSRRASAARSSCCCCPARIVPRRCAIAERVRAELAFRPFAALAPGVRVTLSAGVAVDTARRQPTSCCAPPTRRSTARRAKAATACARAEVRRARRLGTRQSLRCDAAGHTPARGAHPAAGHNSGSPSRSPGWPRSTISPSTTSPARRSSSTATRAR